MANKVYNYKIKASLRKDCKDYEELNAKLSDILNHSELVPLGNNEYGTDDWTEQSAIISILRKQNWFFDNAKELLDFNGDEGEGDDPNKDDFYDVEDVLEIVKNMKKKRI